MSHDPILDDDTEKTESENYVENDNLITLIKNGLVKHGISLFVLFLIFILINLNSFINTVVARFDQAVVDDKLTFKGYIIQDIILVSSFAVFTIFY